MVRGDGTIEGTIAKQMMNGGLTLKLVDRIGDGTGEVLARTPFQVR